MTDHRQYAPTTARNRPFILDVLRDVLPTTGVILEIASGSGEHVVHFASNFPRIVFQPSDPEPEALLSVAAWVKAAQVTNVRAPIVLDASQSPWPIARDPFCCVGWRRAPPPARRRSCRPEEARTASRRPPVSRSHAPSSAPCRAVGDLWADTHEDFSRIVSRAWRIVIRSAGADCSLGTAKGAI